jgi:flagellar motor switch protein FliN/FliY
MAQSPQDTAGGSEGSLSQEEVDAALTEARLNREASAEGTPGAAAGTAGSQPAPPPEAALPTPDQQVTVGAAPNVTEAAQTERRSEADDATAAPAGAAREVPAQPDDAAVPVDMPDFAAGNGNGKGKALELDKLQMLQDVQLQVRIELGRTRMLVQDVLRLDQGSVVELDKLAGDPVDVYVNERLVGRGEVLVLNDNFCVRINEIVSTPQETIA